MKNKPIIIVAAEHKSVFLEIFFKSLKSNKFKSPIILICCKKILLKQMKQNKFKKKINDIDLKNITKYKINNKCLNLINIECQTINNKYIKKFDNKYIAKSFNIALELIKKNFSNKLINGPIDKKSFLKKKYPGVTEYISDKYGINKSGMLIYNEILSVCPVTTHLPIKLVAKKITKSFIKEKIILVDNFFRKKIRKKPKIAVLGLNPHCESILDYNEDTEIISPAVKKLKKRGINVHGPFPADNFFNKKNIKIFDVVIGMYHDQVLTPIKTLFGFNAINITMGLPFFRITPDHGPNFQMFGKNNSSPNSLIKALKFLDKI